MVQGAASSPMGSSNRELVWLSSLYPPEPTWVHVRVLHNQQYFSILAISQRRARPPEEAKVGSHILPCLPAGAEGASHRSHSPPRSSLFTPEHQREFRSKRPPLYIAARKRAAPHAHTHPYKMESRAQNGVSSHTRWRYLEKPPR